MSICSQLLRSAMLASVLCLPITAAAAPSDQEWLAFTQSAVNQHILPRYQELKINSSEFAEQTRALCANPSQDALEKTRTRFKETLQSWQGIQHVQFGPITLLMRNYGMQYWPDKKNIGGKQLRKALADEEATFDQDYFLEVSISLKGFPAIEKLIFTKQNGQELLQASSRSCQLLSAIAQHVASNSAAIVEEWQAELDALMHPGEEETYESAQDSAIAVLKILVEPVEVIRDIKLNSPLGKSSDSTRWRKSESWRSGQSLVNLNSNLAALHELYSGTKPISFKDILEQHGDAQQASLIDTGFNMIRYDLSRLSPVENMTVTEAQYQQMMRISDQLRALQHQLLSAIAGLDLHLGFNSRDGD